MCLFFSDKSIVLFEFLTIGEKRSKQIKGPHHYQGHASSTRKKFDDGQTTGRVKNETMMWNWKNNAFHLLLLILFLEQHHHDAAG
jgi:hypothetical protein